MLRLITVAVAVASAAASSAADADLVTSIPGFEGDFCWKHWAGYLPVKNTDKNLFYWYHESTTDAASKPLVLWLNGGPGCSSLGGMFTELGPFVLDASLNVTLNPFSFNQAANILFIEQPAGVGFSYPLKGKSNDSEAANDTDTALRAFVDMHPELKGRPFFVMGESYGGHYVPNTAKAVQEGNAALTPAQRAAGDAINLKGFAVGNGYTDWELDFNANVENGRYHALPSHARFDAANKACGGDFARCFWPRADKVCPAACDTAVQAATTDAMDGSIDIYDIYEDVCLDPSSEARLETQATVLLGHRRKAQQAHLDRQAQAQVKTQGEDGAVQRRGRRAQVVISPVFPTCIDSSSAKYLNRADVQAAIHIKAGTVPKGKWSDCGNVDYDFNYASELPNYKQWAAAGELNILIYNGDADFILSHMGNAAWINEGLQLEKDREWSKWRGSDGQVAGYFETYATGVNATNDEGKGVPLSFLTVKGAGHMVPRDRPQHALDMFEQFIAGGQNYDQVKRAAPKPLCAAR